MLVNLRKQCADLHVRLALVLEHFKLKGRVRRVVEIVLSVLTIKIVETLLKTNGALVKHSQLLVAECHVVHRQQKDKLVVLVLLGLDLIKHCLRLLQKDQSLLETFLRDEVDSTLVKFVDNDWHLV